MLNHSHNVLQYAKQELKKKLVLQKGEKTNDIPVKEPWTKKFRFREGSDSLSVDFPTVDNQYNWSIIPAMDSNYVCSYWN